MIRFIRTKVAGTVEGGVVEWVYWSRWQSGTIYRRISTGIWTEGVVNMNEGVDAQSAMNNGSATTSYALF